MELKKIEKFINTCLLIKKNTSFDNFNIHFVEMTAILIPNAISGVIG